MRPWCFFNLCYKPIVFSELYTSSKYLILLSTKKYFYNDSNSEQDEKHKKYKEGEG